MSGVRSLLESERRVERDFVAGDRPDAKGWTVAQTMFHLARWRERMVNALIEVRDGRPQTTPPANMDEFNDAEMTGAAGIPLAESAARTDSLLSELIDLYESVGERPFEWYRWQTTREALLGNSYWHPRYHLFMYSRENGDTDAAVRLLESTAAELREADATPALLASALYNLACGLIELGRRDEALTVLEEGVGMRPQIREFAPSDPDLAPVLDDPRFQALMRPV